ncbi:tRNA-i(6)A37 thiotransferase enzyme MiaB [Desulfofarcimen acetoxidans DSM 771]|uniref:tRNA-2-methylthio-N(6)-dimethylallyladenosine synthase n=1 Tax=Desulfofarcimen acetoxidans (strain ATCC 49208 / DSM 771 / KCTC 5769 / VKM B-1644 / 5575) TaxID=485916 RepID=C8VZ41_DESAS|nr:tRNA (N6-isopentenyl adenosine(37)-C2)-methylthiotransferase MiaB [Desulfofarcimen acetoxidans]ACV62951.1 tRNA-i(6)A37 thiotransferase enzyme MiaB [Desulfofarcimen acetoxidans DSM 771]
MEFEQEATGHKKYLIITFGCQMNEHDSEILAGILHNKGYIKTDKQEDADIILLNTCCIRETAESKVYGMLGRLRRLKKSNPDLVLGVCGCMTQQAEAAKKLRQRFPYVDLIFGTHNSHLLSDLLDKVMEKREPVLDVWSDVAPVTGELPVQRVSGIKALVNITYGCNNFCTYCIVPYVRGRERSRSPEDILQEVGGLVIAGYKEVTLLGQNVNSYGKDLKNPLDFADLLLMLEDTGIERIRYMTSHPRDFSDKLIQVIAKSKKVCEHFHLPVQAGSNRILRLMNRGYTRENYLELVDKIRCAVPQAGITTDIIVGFPGETEADFAATLDLLEKVRCYSAYTFVYNKRSGTPAANMQEQIEATVKKARIQELIKMQNKISLADNEAEVGRILDVLVEGPGKTGNNLTGRTRTNKLVVFAAQANFLTGQTVPVKIIKGRLSHLDGCPVNIKND